MKLVASAAGVAMLMGLLACSRGPQQVGTPGNEYDLTEGELAAATRKAESGDLASMRRLVDYYNWVHSDPDKAIPWLRAAARQNDPDSKEELAGRIVESGAEADCREAQRLLESASNLSDGEQRARIQADLAWLAQGTDGSGPCVQWLRVDGTTLEEESH